MQYSSQSLAIYHKLHPIIKALPIVIKELPRRSLELGLPVNRGISLVVATAGTKEPVLILQLGNPEFIGLYTDNAIASARQHEGVYHAGALPQGVGDTVFAANPKEIFNPCGCSILIEDVPCILAMDGLPLEWNVAILLSVAAVADLSSDAKLAQLRQTIGASTRRTVRFEEMFLTDV